MKKIIFPVIIILTTISCERTDNQTVDNLVGKWKVYSTKVLSVENNSCNYITKASDFYFKPINQTCENDNLYIFSNSNSLTINYGSNKCNSNEPTEENKSYSKSNNKLFIDNEKYRIVHLSKDTLIIDYCASINSVPNMNTKGKVGIKLIKQY